METQIQPNKDNIFKVTTIQATVIVSFHMYTADLILNFNRDIKSKLMRQLLLLLFLQISCLCLYNCVLACAAWFGPQQLISSDAQWYSLQMEWNDSIRRGAREKRRYIIQLQTVSIVLFECLLTNVWSQTRLWFEMHCRSSSSTRNTAQHSTIQMEYWT